MTWRTTATLCTLLAATGLAADTNNLDHRRAVGLTNGYITAQVSLDYPGFEGLSVDSLGKEHFPAVTLLPPRGLARRSRLRAAVLAWIPAPRRCQSTPARWAIEVGEKGLRLESRWSAEDPPEPLVLDFENSLCHVTCWG